MLRQYFEGSPYKEIMKLIILIFFLCLSQRIDPTPNLPLCTKMDVQLLFMSQ